MVKKKKEKALPTHTLQFVVNQELEYHIVLQSDENIKTIRERILSGEIKLGKPRRSTLKILRTNDSQELLI